MNSRLGWLIGFGALLAIAAGAYYFFSQPPAFADATSPVTYFYRDNCEWCVKEKSVLNELADEGFRVKLVDLGANPALWGEYGISGTPTFIASNGDRQVGYLDKEPLRAWLLSHGAKING